MKRFVEGEDRTQATLLPERLDDYVALDNPVWVIDVFVEELDREISFVGPDRAGVHLSVAAADTPAFAQVL